MPSDFLSEAFHGPAWHGPALWPAVRGVTGLQAAWRPSRAAHNIWEITVHAAYWKHVVRRRLTGGHDRFPRRGRNWFRRAGSSNQWEDDLVLLADEHDRLASAVAGLPARSLGRIVHAGQTAADNIRGIAAHDIYHAAQIQLLKKLAPR